VTWERKHLKTGDRVRCLDSGRVGEYLRGYLTGTGSVIWDDFPAAVDHSGEWNLTALDVISKQ